MTKDTRLHEAVDGLLELFFRAGSPYSIEKHYQTVVPADVANAIYDILGAFCDIDRVEKYQNWKAAQEDGIEEAQL